MLDANLQTQFLLETKPLPAVGCQQSLKRSDLACSANYSVCVSHPMKYFKYFGYQLVTLTTLEDVLLALHLVLANVEERLVAEE